MIQFKVGEAYSAVPALEGAKRRLVVVIGREGCHIQLAWCDALTVGLVKAFDFGREFVQVRRLDGVYSVSAACRVDAVTASEVLELIRNDIHEQEVANG